MDKQALIEEIKKLSAARTCCPELKRAVQSYLIALGKHNEKIAAQNLIAEIEKDLVTIDELLAFARSAHAIQILGKDAARKLLAHANELKANGAKYCDCPACTHAAKILQHKEILLDAKNNSPDKQALHEKLKAIAASPSCYPDLRDAIKIYFAALGTFREKVVAENLIDELKADVVPIELLVINAHSNRMIEMFGAERAKIFAENADALKASGAKYCNCLACTLGLEVLNNKEILLR